MTSGEHRVFVARMAALPEAAAFVERFAHSHGIGHDDALRLTLIVEELFTNTVTHGYAGDCDGSIGIALSAGGSEVELRYEDSAPRYDPLSRLSQSQIGVEATLESRPAGGLGIHLVKQLATSVTYVYEDSRNRLWLKLPRRG